MKLVDIVLGERQLQLNDESQANGVMVGIVRDDADPLFLSRVRVSVGAIDSNDPLPWARVAVPAASMASGFYWIPAVGDEVLVAFEHGDLNAPYVIGCLWSATMVPPIPSPKPGMRMIRTPTGNQIVFTETPATITITTADLTQRVVLSPAGISVTVGGNNILMTQGDITIQSAGTINLTGGAAININAPSVQLSGTVTTTVGSPASPTTVSGAAVAIG